MNLKSEMGMALMEDVGWLEASLCSSVAIATSVALWLKPRARGGKSLVCTIIQPSKGQRFAIRLHSDARFHFFPPRVFHPTYLSLLLLRILLYFVRTQLFCFYFVVTCHIIHAPDNISWMNFLHKNAKLQEFSQRFVIIILLLFHRGSFVTIYIFSLDIFTYWHNSTSGVQKFCFCKQVELGWQNLEKSWF